VALRHYESAGSDNRFTSTTWRIYPDNEIGLLRNALGAPLPSTAPVYFVQSIIIQLSSNSFPDQQKDQSSKCNPLRSSALPELLAPLHSERTQLSSHSKLNPPSSAVQKLGLRGLRGKEGRDGRVAGREERVQLVLGQCQMRREQAGPRECGIVQLG
jgi:hypothetical protein